MAYAPTEGELALLQVTFDERPGTSRWIEAQHRLFDARRERANSLVGDDPIRTPQTYWDMCEIADLAWDRLVRGCVALARRSGVADAVHQIRAADLGRLEESLLLDAFTRSAY